MDDECAFCGRGDQVDHRLMCEDCQAQHRVCTACADEVASESDLYHLLA
jgi:hypothetical protein